MKNSVVVLFLLAVLLVVGSADNTQCQQDLADAFVTMTYENAPEMRFMCSGRRLPSDLGNYLWCQSLHNAHMCTVTGTLLGSVSSVLGFCVPLSCDSAGVKSNIDFIFSILVVQGVSLTDVKVYCPDDIDHNLDTGAKSIVATMSVFVFLVLVGTVVSAWVAYTKRVPKTRDEEEDSKGEALPLLHVQDDHRPSKPPRSQGKVSLVKLITAFDCVENTRLLLQEPRKTPNRNLDVLNGMRVLSMLWVILGHTDLQVMETSQNADAVFSGHGAYREWYYRIIIAAEYAVDTFFLLSGFLLVFLVFPKFKALGGKINILKVYIHRYLRLTPVYVVVVLFYYKLYAYLGDGPLWYQAQHGSLQKNCDSYWWTHLLYVNNFYPYKMNDQCMGWTWYLANDFQFFMITPLVMWLFVWNQIAGWVVMALLLGGSFLSTGLVVHHYDLSSTLVSPRFGRYMDYVYEKPYCRISPYLVGMALAFVLIYVQRHKLQRLARWMIYLVALAIMSLCFYGDYENYHHTNIEDKSKSSYWSKDQDLFYITFSRFGWAVGVALLAYPMIVGYGKQLAAFLGHWLWLPFARLTYGAYLVHIILIAALFQNLKHFVYYGSTVVTWAFVACAIFAYGVSYVFYLLVEKPMMNIEKMVLG